MFYYPGLNPGFLWYNKSILTIKERTNMADNKAEEAVKEANIKLKVYYSGKTLADCGTVEWSYNMEPLDKNHKPWLFKFFPNENEPSYIQFVDSSATYRSLSMGLSNILDAVIVNAKQREAVGALIDRLLWNELASDAAHDDDKNCASVV